MRARRARHKKAELPFSRLWRAGYGLLHIFQVLITNGNTLTPADVLRNLANTRADGLMSCEGILRNPLLFAQARRVSEERERNGGDDVDGQGGGATVGESGLSRAELSSVCLEYLSLADGLADGRTQTAVDAACAPDAEELSVVRSHVMWLLGKSGKGERCTFEHLGPYTAPQLRMALMEAASVRELETVARAALQVVS